MADTKSSFLVRALPRRALAALAVLPLLLAPVCVTVLLRPRSSLAQLVGDLTILGAVISAAVGCWYAGRRGGPERRGWQLLAVAMLVWTGAQSLWTFYGLTRNHAYPFPSLADAGFIGWSIPAAVGLLLFPRTAERGVSRLRVVLDALVIAASILIISWVLVLQPLADAGGSGLSVLVSFGYPIADVIVASLVLALGMRVPAGARRPWLLLGLGLIALSVTDSFYVARTAQLDTGLTGTPLAFGWTIAFLLVAVASQMPTTQLAVARRRHFNVVQELLPYLPLVAALAITHDKRFRPSEPFLFYNGVALLTLFAIQQVLIAIEKVQLANGLEKQVTQRTAEATSADERVRSLIEYSEDAILTQSVQGTVVSWNPAAERLYGYTSEEMIGASVETIIPESLRALETEMAASLAAGAQVPNYETDRLRKDGSTVAVALTVSPIYVDGQVVGSSAISHDISQRKREQEELAHARNEALDASRAKSDFLATMSHEIRTPMNGVIGLTELLLGTPLDDVQRRYAAGVRGAGEALLAIIDDILDFSKLEADKVQLEDADYDPRQLIEEVGLLLAGSAAAKGLELVAYCEPEVPHALRGDAGRLRQILINLASNALKFTETGEVVLQARLARSSGGRVDIEFTVRDTGIGIASADHQRMFEPFSQADASTTRRFGGTGLGLAICWRLVGAMGGTLAVESAEGVGSTFRFTLPTTARPALPSRTPPLPGMLDGMAVLVVDDNETNRLILATQLRSWGMEPAVAADAATGLAMIRAAARKRAAYPLVILDLCMPDVDGLALAAEIHADPELRDVRMMLLSSAGPVDRATAAAVGLTTCINKPVRLSELHDSLVHLVDGRGAAPAPAAAAPMVKPNILGRVLVVEDNHVNQMVAEGVLDKLGYIVEVAPNGRVALTAMRSGSFDAVLMDCHMPEMDGFAATIEWRRGESPGARLPIIAMTAGVLADDRERCLAAGMDDFVAKPIDVELLRRVLTTWITTRRGTTSMPPPVESALTAGEPEAATAIDRSRLDVLRAIGPKDGWGMLPAVVDAFLAELSEQHAAIDDAAASGDPVALASAAHKLRGAAANLGAVTVAAICGDLEAMARTGSAPADTSALSRLARELDRAGNALSRELVGRP